MNSNSVQTGSTARTMTDILAPLDDGELQQLAGKFWRGFNRLCDAAETARADMDHFAPATLQHKQLHALSRSAMAAMREIRDLHDITCLQVLQRGQEA